jgi:hypothetical protein
MVTWIRDFSNTYKSKTGVYPGTWSFNAAPANPLSVILSVIYTTTDWWKTCTGNNGSFGSTNPLWIARYASAVGTLPNGWRRVLRLLTLEVSS